MRPTKNLIPFLKLNPNIDFSFRYFHLDEMANILNDGDFIINRIILDAFVESYRDSSFSVKRISDQLNTLKQKELFNCVQLIINNEENIKYGLELIDGLEYLICTEIIHFEFSKPLFDLKRLKLSSIPPDDFDLKRNIWKYLPNLEAIYLNADSDYMNFLLSAVHHLPKLNTIFIYDRQNYRNLKIPNMKAFNEVRKDLRGASKIVIHIYSCKLANGCHEAAKFMWNEDNLVNLKISYSYVHMDRDHESEDSIYHQNNCID